MTFKNVFSFTALLLLSGLMSAQTTGLCNQEEVDMLTADPAGATQIATNCFSSCLTSFDQEACMAECLQTAYPNTSAECLSCGVDQVDCVLSNCAFACLNANSPACQQCVLENCSQGFLNCIGDSDGDGFTQDGGDCNDQDPFVNPLMYDIPNDGIDQDCDGMDFTVGLAEQTGPESPKMYYLEGQGLVVELDRGMASLKMYDLTGRMVRAPELLNAGKNAISLPGLSPGIYLLTLSNGELIVSSKVYLN